MARPKGIPASEEWKKWQSERVRGVPKSLEQRRKMSESHKGIPAAYRLNHNRKKDEIIYIDEDGNESIVNGQMNVR